jgi:hypothetical protein
MYRLLFALAALYNLAFGAWAALFPHSFFRLFALAPPLYPSIWACLGMVVGLYGLVYMWVAWKPEQGAVLIGIGLLGKLLGPMGWLRAVWLGEWPARTYPIVLCNDLIWWFPFLCYLLRHLRWRRSVMAAACVACNAAACVGLLLVRSGTEAVPDLAERARWIGSATPLWATIWFMWSLASMSLLAFFVAWASHLVQAGGSRIAALGSCLLCALGVVCDLGGEVVNIVWLPEAVYRLAEFVYAADIYRWLSPVTANGLYCLAGLLLNGVAWRSGCLHRPLALLGVGVWTVGLTLTATAILKMYGGMIVAGAAVMTLFLPWAALVGWRLRPG